MAKLDWSSNIDEVFGVLLREYLRNRRNYMDRSLAEVSEILGAKVPKSALNSAIFTHGLRDRLRASAEAFDGEHEVLDPTHPELRDAERKILALGEQVRVETKKRKEADKGATIVAQLAEVIREAATPLEPRPLTVKATGGGPYHVDGVLILSDEHADHVIHPELTMGLEDFDFDIFRVRAERLQNTVIRYVTHHLPQYSFDRLWIVKLGDAIQGDIHNMKLRNHFGNAIRAAIATADVEAEMVANLAQYFPGGVHVVSVPGNHPRTTKTPQHEDPTDNLDYLIAAGMASRLSDHIAEGLVTVNAPRSWGALIDVRGWLVHASHGDNVRGFAGLPWYGFDRYENRVKDLFSQVLDRPIDYFLHGHYHTSTERTTASSQGLHNGAFYQTGGYEIHALAVGNRPRQDFYVLQDREVDRGYTFKIPIWLKNQAKEQAFRRGEFLTLDTIEGSTKENAKNGLSPIITGA
jgi:hypothetical protein